MDKNTYISDPDVKAFSKWFSMRLDTPDLQHSWINRRDNTSWHCESIYDAFKKYYWRFNLALPNSKHCSGVKYVESKKVLPGIRIPYLQLFLFSFPVSFNNSPNILCTVL